MVDSTHCELYIAFGKGCVFEVLAELMKDKTPGVVAIVDADCDHLANIVRKDKNVITTETRDIEGLLLKAPALDKVLNQYDYPSQLSGTPTRDLLLRAARTLGYIRWLSLHNKWSLDFKCLYFKSFIDQFKLECDDKKLSDELIAKNPGFAVSGEEIMKYALQLMDTSHDLWCVANGHDMSKILAVAISARGREIHSAAIESALRLAFEEVHFKATSLFTAICCWQSSNRPFVILKIHCS